MTTTLEPMFHSTHEALMFAFNFSLQQYDAPPMAKLMRGAIGSGRGLVGLDGAGQSGLVRAEVMALPGVQQYILAARYASRSVPCDCRKPCCSGQMVGKEYREAIEWLTDYVLRAALTGCTSNHRLRRLLVLRSFGVKAGSLEDISDETGVHRNTVSDQNQRVQKHLRDLEDKAQRAIDDRLRACGMVGEE